MTELFLEGSSTHVHVQPVVLLSILDHFVRRKEGQERVIGTLLGTAVGSKVEVTNCFAVPHAETDEQVAMDLDHQRTMHELHQRVNSREVIVGWYATGSEITEYSALIHEFYGRETEGREPIHLLVDTTLRSGRATVSAVVGSVVGVPGRTQGTVFTPVRCEVVYHDSERAAVGMLARCRPADAALSLASDLDHVEEATKATRAMLDKCLQYVSRVVAGEVPGDARIGRFLLDTISAVPKIDAAQFEKMFNNVVQDLLMVVYLSNLTRTQVALQEKLMNMA